MARPRNETEPGVWNVWARGVERRIIFVDDEDRRLYLRLLGMVVERFRWRVLAYCLMPNHVHLLIETQEPNLGRGMHCLHGLYARLFNEKYVRVGHLFQGRFGSRRLYDEVQVARVVGYIAANPVVAALCAEPEDWDWSSYRAATRVARDPIVDLSRLRAYLRAAGTSIWEVVVRSRLSAALRSPG
jgi:REP element-mobilizing transposase RayT